MRFALVGPTIEENLSLGYLAAALRAAGHEAVSISFAWDREGPEVRRRILEERPDAVGLSMTFQARGRSFLALAADLRAAGFAGPILGGGHWASLAATEILRDHPAIDFILRGEAERSIVDLAEMLVGRRAPTEVPGLVGREAGGAVREWAPPAEFAALDALPPPARDAPPLTRLGIPWAPLLASRGCRGRCRFCSIAAFHRLGPGTARRVRAPERVADEMAALWRERGVRIFVFHDDDFFLGRHADDVDRVERLGAAMAERGLPRVALALKARPDDLHEDVVRRLRDLGLVRLFLGIENDAPAGLRALGRGVDPPRNHRALALLRRLGVFVSSNLLIWEPDATLDDLRANLDLLRAFPDQLFNVGRVEAYEGAPLTLRLAEQGRLRGDYLGRDYAVADPRAELAFRLHRVVLGERCYPLDGLMHRATGLGFDARVLLHFHPSPRAADAAAEVEAFLRRLARSLADGLACLIDYAATAPLDADPAVVRFALDAARAARAEEVRLWADLRALEGKLERCARGEPEPVGRDAPPRRRARRAAAFVAAAAGALACSRGGAAAARSPETTPAAEPHEAAAADAAVRTSEEAGVAVSPATDGAPFEAVPADSDAVVLSVAAERERFRSCPADARATAFRLEARLEGDVAARFDRFEATDGRVDDLYVAPNGKRAFAIYRPGEARGPQRVTAVFVREGAGAGTLTRRQWFFQYGGHAATLGPDEVPEVECGVICDPVAVPPDTVLEREGDVIFGRPGLGSGPLTGWATTFKFSVGLRADIEGEVVGAPTIECTTGTASIDDEGVWGIVESEAGRWPPDRRGRSAARDVYRVRFDPRPPDGSGGRLVAGDHACTVRFTVERGAKRRVYEGTLRIRVGEDGTVQLGPAPEPPGPGAAREVPAALPHRYAVHVRCLADDGDALLLEALSPAARELGPPAFRWSASAGTIEALGGGERALWRLAADGGPAVAVCAVQTGPLDLQVATYRVGG